MQIKFSQEPSINATIRGKQSSKKRFQMKRIALLLLILIARFSHADACKYGLGYADYVTCSSRITEALERVAAAKTICLSGNSTVEWNKNSEKPSWAWAAIEAGESVAIKDFTVRTCANADLVLKYVYDESSETVTINVTDAESGATVFAESRSVSDLDSDAVRMANHWHEMVVNAREQARAAIAEAERTRQCETGFDSLSASKNQVAAATVGQYHFKTYKSGDGECLQVTSGGKVVYSDDHNETYTLGQPADPQDNIPTIANGTDVTGRGRPDMIVEADSGGSSGDSSLFVFELEPQFKLLAKLDGVGYVYFERDAKDGRYYYVTALKFLGQLCNACEPWATVTLRFVDDAMGGAFHLAMDKMQTPAPEPAEWNKELSAAQTAVNQGSMEDIGKTMWQTVLNLIYGGHSDLAWKFVDEVGPEAQQGQFPTLADFCLALKEDTYWADLEPTLRDTPAACANAKPEQSN
jgi:hypothetical protein